MNVIPRKNNIIDEKELDKIVRQRMEEGKKKIGYLPYGNYSIYDDYNWMRNEVIAELEEEDRKKKGIPDPPYIDCLVEQWMNAKISVARILLIAALIVSFFLRGGHILLPLEIFIYYKYKKHIRKEAIKASKKK